MNELVTHLEEQTALAIKLWRGIWMEKANLDIPKITQERMVEKEVPANGIPAEHYLLCHIWIQH